MNIVREETTPEQAAAMLNELASEFARYSSPADAVMECLPYGTVVEERRENGEVVRLPTGQRLRMFLKVGAQNGACEHKPGFDHHTENADELGKEE